MDPAGGSRWPVRGGPAVQPCPRQRRLHPLCSVLPAVQENNNPHKDPFISAPRCSPTPYPPTARGQCPHAAGGANQGSTADLAGRKQLGLVSSRTGPPWVRPGGLPHAWCRLPQTAGLRPAGQWGQDRAGQGRKESETLTTSSCDRAGRPRASRDRPQPHLPPASSLQKNVCLLGPPRVPENIFKQRSKKMRGQAGWAPRALQRASPADDQGRRPSRPRGNPPWLLG